LGLPDGRRAPSHAKLRRSVDDQMCAKPPLAIALSATSLALTPDGTPILDVSADDSKFTLTLTVANPSQRTIAFLKRGTPFEGFVSNSFIVTDIDGGIMGYRGPDVNYANEVHVNEYVVLEPGASLSQSVTMGGVYKLGNDGLYTITYTAGIEWTDHPTSGSYEGVQFCHTQVEQSDKGLNQMVQEVKVQGTAAYTARHQRRQSKRVADAHHTRDATRRTGSRPWSTHHCSNNQTEALDSWIKDATQKIDSARACSECSCADLVDTWFGASTSQSDFKLVTEKFDIMRDKMDDSIYECEPDQSPSPPSPDTSTDGRMADICGGSVFAYVYPTDSTQRVYMCDFTFNFHEYSEKVVTLIHELSHFNTIADTDDVPHPDTGWTAYGQPACYELAQDYPDLAMKNADSLAYFATFQNTCFENGPDDDYQPHVPPCAWCAAVQQQGIRADQDCGTPLPSNFFLSDDKTFCENSNSAASTASFIRAWKHCDTCRTYMHPPFLSEGCRDSCSRIAGSSTGGEFDSDSPGTGGAFG